MNRVDQRRPNEMLIKITDLIGIAAVFYIKLITTLDCTIPVYGDDDDDNGVYD